MASTNQSPQYQQAEAKFLQAKKDEDRIYWLEEMIRECPKHKSSEKMLANLKTRYKKLKEKSEKNSKKSKKTKSGIKKEELQAVIVGYTNVGKSSLLSSLTNAFPEIAPYSFTTKKPIVGMMNYGNTQIQIIEVPSIESEYYDRGIVNTADVIMILVTKIQDIEEIEKNLERTRGKRIIVFNTKEIQDSRKIEATLKSKRYNFVVISTEKKENLEELKDKIFLDFGKIRVYTKEPGKDKSQKPMILEKNSSVKIIAEKILKNMSDLRETRIWGPSSKFPGQIVGLNHQLKDLDVIEFKTR